MTEHRFLRSRTKRPVEVGLRVLEASSLYVGGPHNLSLPERRGTVTGRTDAFVYITWDADTEPTAYPWKELLKWDTCIASYHRPSVAYTIVTLFEED